MTCAILGHLGIFELECLMSLRLDKLRRADLLAICIALCGCTRANQLERHDSTGVGQRSVGWNHRLYSGGDRPLGAEHGH